jgi:hypothetical protein
MDRVIAIPLEGSKTVGIPHFSFEVICDETEL